MLPARQVELDRNDIPQVQVHQKQQARRWTGRSKNLKSSLENNQGKLKNKNLIEIY